MKKKHKSEPFVSLRLFWKTYSSNSADGNKQSMATFQIFTHQHGISIAVDTLAPSSWQRYSSKSGKMVRLENKNALQQFEWGQHHCISCATFVLSDWECFWCFGMSRARPKTQHPFVGSRRLRLPPSKSTCRISSIFVCLFVCLWIRKISKNKLELRWLDV